MGAAHQGISRRCTSRFCWYKMDACPRSNLASATNELRRAQIFRCSAWLLWGRSQTAEESSHKSYVEVEEPDPGWTTRTETNLASGIARSISRFFESPLVPSDTAPHLLDVRLCHSRLPQRADRELEACRGSATCRQHMAYVCRSVICEGECDLTALSHLGFRICDIRHLLLGHSLVILFLSAVRPKLF